MKRLIVGLAVLMAVVALAGAGAAWDEYLRPPRIESNQLPDGLISLNSAAGQKLLAQSEASADYEDLVEHFEPQSRRAYCGVASAVVALNTVRGTQPPLDQGSVLAQSPIRKGYAWKVSFIGMSLGDLGDVLRANGAKVTIVYASETNIDAFRTVARENLRTPGNVLLVNYERKYLGQLPSGHISPIAAYHPDSDRLLILDVARHKYPPVWVTVDALWEAMSAPLNETTSTTRGYAVVDEGPPKTLAGATHAPIAVDDARRAAAAARVADEETAAIAAAVPECC